VSAQRRKSECVLLKACAARGQRFIVPRPIREGKENLFRGTWRLPELVIPKYLTPLVIREVAVANGLAIGISPWLGKETASHPVDSDLMCSIAFDLKSSCQ
jgi:hypothetical protein